MTIKPWLIVLCIARKLRDNKGVIRSCKSFKESQTIQLPEEKGQKRQTIVGKTLCRNLNIEQQHEPHQYQV
jgi:hypothetical protein